MSNSFNREIEREKEKQELKADKEVILSSMLRSMQRDRISSLGGNKDE